MLLTEILNRPYEYELEPGSDAFSGPGDWIAYFKDDSDEMTIVNFEYWAGPELCIVDFKRKGSFKMTNDSPEDRNQGVRIMSTVIAIIKDVLQKQGTEHPIKFIAYSVHKDEKSRGTLYDKLMKRVVASVGFKEVQDVTTVKHDVLPGWWKNHVKMVGGEHNFVLLAKDE